MNFTGIGVKRMKKRTIILFIILGLVLYVVLGALLPSISHREVTEDYKKIIEGVTYTDESISASVDYIDDNVDALIYRIKMAEAAKKEIIVTTFAFHADDAGKEVMATLLEAADRGVKVKIIADGMNAVIQIYRDAYFAALAVHDNIEIKI